MTMIPLTFPSGTAFDRKVVQLQPPKFLIYPHQIASCTLDRDLNEPFTEQHKTVRSKISFTVLCNRLCNKNQSASHHYLPFILPFCFSSVINNTNCSNCLLQSMKYSAKGIENHTEMYIYFVIFFFSIFDQTFS